MTNQKKITKLSRILRFLTFITIGAFAFFEISFWITRSFSISALPASAMAFIPSEMKAQIPPLSGMSFFMKLIGCVAYFIPFIAKVVALSFLAKLFKYYQNLQIFSQGAIRTIRNIGFTVLIGSFLEIATSVIVFLSLPDAFPIPDRLKMGSLVLGPIGYNMRFIGVALFMILVSWIMEIGRRIQEEQEHTV